MLCCRPVQYEGVNGKYQTSRIPDWPGKTASIYKAIKRYSMASTISMIISCPNVSALSGFGDFHKFFHCDPKKQNRIWESFKNFWKTLSWTHQYCFDCLRCQKLEGESSDVARVVHRKTSTQFYKKQKLKECINLFWVMQYYRVQN